MNIQKTIEMVLEDVREVNMLLDAHDQVFTCVGPEWMLVRRIIVERIEMLQCNVRERAGMDFEQAHKWIVDMGLL